MEATQPTQPTQPAESESTDWPKIVLATVLGFGLLATAAYVGYWYGTQQVRSTKEPTPAVAQPTPTIEDQTKGWEIHTNTNYDYSIKYPSNWYFREILREERNGAKFGGGVILSSYNEPSQPWPTKRAKIEIHVAGNQGGLSPEEWIREKRKNAQEPEYIAREERVFVGGVEALKRVAASPDGASDLERGIYTIYATREDKMYQLWVGSDENYDLIVYQILSTFKFLD